MHAHIYTKNIEVFHHILLFRMDGENIMGELKDVDFGTLYRMVIMPIRSKLLMTGIELKIFNQLSNPQSASGSSLITVSPSILERRIW